MNARKIAFAAMILTALTLSFADAGDKQKAADASIKGAITIYNVSDLVREIPDQTPNDGTRGEKTPVEPPQIEQIGKLIRSTVAPDAWGKTAEMTISGGDKIIVKCGQGSPAELFRSIDGLLVQLRENRGLYVEFHYRVVDSQDQDVADQDGVVTGLALDRLDHAKEIVADSQILVYNGQEKSLWDRAVANLHAVYVQATISADRKYVTVSVYESSGPGQSNKPIIYSIAAGAPAAIRIGDPRSHQWLILNAKLLQLEQVDVHPSPRAHGEQ